MWLFMFEGGGRQKARLVNVKGFINREMKYVRLQDVRKNKLMSHMGQNHRNLKQTYIPLVFLEFFQKAKIAKGIPPPNTEIKDLMIEAYGLKIYSCDYSLYTSNGLHLTIFVGA